MKFVVCSDLHLGGAHYRKHDPDTLNVYMLNNFKNFEFIAEYCKKHNEIEAMIIPGDVFDRSNISTYALYEAKRIFDSMKGCLPKGIHAIKGNHDKSDILDKKGFTAIDLLDINSYNKNGSAKIDNINFVFNPWGEEVDIDAIDTNYTNILVSHSYPKDYFSYLRNKDEIPEDVLDTNVAKRFDMVLTGHYHSTDEFKEGNTQFINPGSISPSTSTKEHEPSFYVIDSKDLSYKRIPIDNAMKIIYDETTDIDEYLSNINDNNIYRIKSDKPADKLALIKAQRIATDIQITVDKVERKAIEKIDNFWDFIHNNHPEYEKEFRDIVGMNE